MDLQTYLAEGIQESSREVDWEAAYADMEPRVYNYFRHQITMRPGLVQKCRLGVRGAPQNGILNYT